MKKCLIFINSYNEVACKLAVEVQDFLKVKGFSSQKISYSGQKSINSDYNFNENDEILCAITLGGDGTVLFASRFCCKHGIPIFPINLGKFGFIAGIHADKWQTEFEEFLAGNLVAVERSMVCANIVRGNKVVFSSNALNDVAITGRGVARIVSLGVCCNKNDLGTFKCDGIVISTATGSTAYSAAAGGPILDPAVDALVLNPICAFTLSNRPLVLPSWSEISVSVLPSRGAEVCLTCDGQVSFDANIGDEIKICMAKEKISLVGCDSKVFYSALCSKLNWSGGTLA